MNTVPANSRVTEPPLGVEVGEEMHHCGFCGTRTDLDEATYYACAARSHTCPHCGQRYSLTDAEDDGAADDDEHHELSEDERFQQHVQPILTELNAECLRQGFFAMTAIVLPGPNALILGVQGNRDGRYPQLFNLAVQAMGSKGPSAAPAGT